MVKFNGPQKCFIGDDGDMLCNAVKLRKRFGDQTLYGRKNGGWWKFKPRKAKVDSEPEPTEG